VDPIDDSASSEHTPARHARQRSVLLAPPPRHEQGPALALYTGEITARACKRAVGEVAPRVAKPPVFAHGPTPLPWAVAVAQINQPSGCVNWSWDATIRVASGWPELWDVDAESVAEFGSFVPPLIAQRNFAALRDSHG